MPPRYSQLYIEITGRQPDSKRARNRIAALLRLVDPGWELGYHVESELGVRLQDHGRRWWNWEAFIVESAEVRDFLDLITEVYRFNEKSNPALARQWRDEARRIFIEERLAHEIDDNSVVHPAVDQEFQRNRTSTIAGLQLARYANVRREFERVSDELRATPPHGKAAWRATFAAAEGLFRLMFPNAPRLTAGEIDSRLRPLLKSQYAQDATGLRVAERLASSLREWVEASHNYRHEPGTQDPAEPPLDIAILAVSQGASFLRWLVELDQANSP